MAFRRFCRAGGKSENRHIPPPLPRKPKKNENKRGLDHHQAVEDGEELALPHGDAVAGEDAPVPRLRSLGPRSPGGKFKLATWLEWETQEAPGFAGLLLVRLFLFVFIFICMYLYMYIFIYYLEKETMFWQQLSA